MIENISDGSNIVSLVSRREDEVFSSISQIDAYWEGLRVGANIPSRAQIDPRGLEDALEYAFILERISPSIFRFRLAGMHLSDLTGMDVRGMPISAMFLPESRAEIGELMKSTCDEQSVKTLTLIAEGGFGKPTLEAKMIMAPLLDENGNVTRILGSLQTKGMIGRQPRRFKIANVQSRFADVTKSEPIGAAIKAPINENPIFQSYEHKKGPSDKRPALRLV